MPEQSSVRQLSGKLSEKIEAALRELVLNNVAYIEAAFSPTIRRHISLDNYVNKLSIDVDKVCG